MRSSFFPCPDIPFRREPTVAKRIAKSNIWPTTSRALVSVAVWAGLSAGCGGGNIAQRGPDAGTDTQVPGTGGATGSGGSIGLPGTGGALGMGGTGGESAGRGDGAAATGGAAG